MSKRLSMLRRWLRPRTQPARKNTRRLTLEALENRVVPAAFTPGNLVIYRVGDGAAGLVNTGAAVFLDEYDPNGTLVQSIALPTTASGSNLQLIASGTATSEGLITRSEDGQYLLVTGYARDLGGSGSLAGTSSTAVPRVIGRIDAEGNVDTSTGLTDAANGNNPRSATSTNGTDLWFTGGAGGIRYATLGSTTSLQLSTTVVNLRQANVFNGQLYVSTSSGSTVRLGTVGEGTPTEDGQTITNLPGFPTSGSPYAYFFADLTADVDGLDTLYVAADDAGALTKYSLVSGSWVSNGTVGVAADAYRGLTATVSGTTVTLYATRKGGSTATGGGEFVSLVDSSGYNGTFGGSPSLLATANANTAFRGIALAPVASDTATVGGITRNDANPTNQATVSWTVSFSRDVTGLQADNFQLVEGGGVSGASLLSVEGSGNSWTVTANSGSGDGTLRLDMINSEGVSPGVSNLPFNGESYTIDKTAPVVDAIVRLDDSPTNAATVRFEVSFSEVVTGVDASDFALATTGVSGASIASVTGSGATYVVTVNTGTGDGSIGLNLVADGSIGDVAGNVVGGDFTGETYVIDKTAPVVDAIVRLDGSPTNAATVRFEVSFSEVVTGVDASDFALTTSGVSGASIASVTGSGATYVVTVNTGTGDGTIRLDLVADGSIGDAAGNVVGGDFTGETYVIDKTAPVVDAIVRLDGSPTNAATVRFEVSFSEVVTGVDASDFALTTSGVSGASITSVTGSGATYVVTVNTGTGDGTIRLDLVADGSIGDAAGNVVGGDFTGETYVIDKTAPVVDAIVRLDGSPTNAATVRFEVSFSEVVTGVDASDFALTTSGVSGASITSVTGSGATYVVTVNTGTGDGSIGLNVVADGSIGDAAGNVVGGDFTGETYVIDKTAPVVDAIIRLDPSPTDAASVQFEVSFSESVTGVDASDFALAASGVSGASIASVTGSGAIYVVTVNTGTGDGTIRLDLVADGSISDAAGNDVGVDFEGETYVIERAIPYVDAITRLDGSPTNAASVQFEVTFTEAVTGVDASDFALATSGVSGASIASVTGSGATYVVTVNTGTGDGTIRLDLVDDDSIVNGQGRPLGGTGAGNGNFTGETYVIDKTAPVVDAIVRLDGSPTNAATVRFEVSFSEAVTGVDASDFALATSGVSGASIASVTGSGATYVVTVNTGTGDGSIGLNLVANGSIGDAAGNVVGGDFTGETYVIDKTAPVVDAIVRLDGSPTNAATVRFEVSFSEAVTGVDASDFALATSGVSGVSITSVTGSGATYVVTVNTGTGDGTIRLDLVANGSIGDAAGNVVGGDFTGETYVIDKTAPVVDAIVRLDGSPTNAASVQFEVTFSEDVTGVDASDFALATSGVSGASIASVTGSGATYVVTVNTGTGDGTIRLDLVANGSIGDAAGNVVGGDFTGETYVIDKTAPVVDAIVRLDGSPTNAATVQFEVSFSEVVTGVDASDFALATSGVSGASIASVTGSGATYVVTVNTGTGDGTIRLDLVANGSIGDAAGNVVGGDFTGETYVIDKTAPVVDAIIRLDPSPTDAASVQFEVTFSEAVTGVDASDFALATSGVNGASITSVTGSGATYVVTVNTGTGDGSIGLNLVADGSIGDAAGNVVGGDFTGETYVIDKTAPVVDAIVRLDGSPTNAASVQYEVTFSEDVTGVDAGDFALATSGVSGASIASVTGSGATYVVTVNTGTGDGSIGLNLVANGSIGDAAGNVVGGDFTGQTYVIDKTAPVVDASIRLDESPTGAATVRFQVSFSEAVTGVDAGDFTLTTTGLVSGASISSVTGAGAVYVVTVITGDGNGDIRLDLVDNDSILDAVGNPLGGVGAGNGNFTSGESYVIFRQENRPPVASAGGPYAILEGQSLALNGSGSFDPDGDPLTYSWDVNGDGIFGDATGVQPVLTWATLIGLGLGDGPNSVNVRVRVDDGQGHVVVSDPTTLAIVNAPPTLVTFAPTSGLDGSNRGVRGYPITFVATATDPSPADTFIYQFDWDGDGTWDEQSAPGQDGTFAATHAFTSTGTYSPRARVIDKDGGVSTVLTISPPITILNVGVVDGNLLVLGTDNRNTIIVQDLGNQGVYATVNGLRSGPFILSSTGRAIIHGGPLADVITVTGRVPTEIYGYAGNDVVTGGAGDDVIWGGAGDDVIVDTQGGNDVLIGGAGKDILNAGSGIDILLGGEFVDGLAHDGVEPYDYHVLRRISRDWVNGIVDPDLAASIADDVIDTERDTMIGGPDRDWFLGNLTGPNADILADFVNLLDKKSST